MLSAKAAKIYCIAVPELDLRGDKRYVIADIVVDSLLDISLNMVRTL